MNYNKASQLFLFFDFCSVILITVSKIYCHGVLDAVKLAVKAKLELNIAKAVPVLGCFKLVREMSTNGLKRKKLNTNPWAIETDRIKVPSLVQNLLKSLPNPTHKFLLVFMTKRCEAYPRKINST